MLEMLIEAIEPQKSQAPVVKLRSLDGKRVLRFPLRAAEAKAIHLGLRGIETARPMTHDLFQASCLAFGIRLRWIEIHRIDENGVFHAALELEGPTGARRIDARASDALALAQRFESVILVSQEVLDNAPVLEL